MSLFLTRAHVLSAVLLLAAPCFASPSVLAAGALNTCDGCRNVGVVTLCEGHLAQETQFLEKWTWTLNEGAPEKKIEVLEKLAKMTLGHENAPSVRVVSRLLIALDDEAIEVQRAAVALLAQGQNQAAMIDGVVEAAGRLAKRLERLEAETDKIDAAVEKKKSKRRTTSGQKKVALIKDLNKLTDLLSGIEGLVNKQLRHWELREAYSNLLVTLRDDRSVDALVQFAKSNSTKTSPMPLVNALLELGSRDALLAAVKQVEWYQDQYKDCSKSLKKAEESKPERLPEYWNATEDAWIARHQKEKDKQVEFAKSRLATCELVGDELHAALTKVASRIESPKPPSRSTRPYSAWRRWLSQNEDQFPESLGKLDSSE
ncbi:MAG: hypothetical protein ACI835_003969 [Planctomycetota bacterium]|jgi:hypothetical protein